MTVAEKLACIVDNEGCVPDNVEFKERISMKIKTTFYTRKKGKDFDPVIHVVYPRNRADQLSYQPTADLVDQMFRTGQMVQASKQYYDFPDGKDTGLDVPLDRQRGLEMPEISQMMLSNENKLKEHRQEFADMVNTDRTAKAKKASETHEKASRSDDKALSDKKSD